MPDPIVPPEPPPPPIHRKPAVRSDDFFIDTRGKRRKPTALPSKLAAEQPAQSDGPASPRFQWLARSLFTIAVVLLIVSAASTFLWRKARKAAQDRASLLAANPSPTPPSLTKSDSSSEIETTPTDRPPASVDPGRAPKGAETAAQPTTPDAKPAAMPKSKSAENNSIGLDAAKGSTKNSPESPLAQPKDPSETSQRTVPPKKVVPKAIPTDPLASLPSSVALPDLASNSAATVLGSLAFDSKAICVIHLLGGETAMKGTQRFTMDAADDGAAERDWEIRFVSSASAKSQPTGVKIAHLALRNEKLTFQWLDEALGQAQSPYLCNCVLRIAAGKGTRTIALRRPLRGEDLELNFSEGCKVAYDVPFAPAAEQLRVELRPTREMPRHRFVGSSILRGPSETTWIDFVGRRETSGFQLRVEMELKRQLQIEVTPFFQVAPNSKPMRLTTGTMKKQREAAKATEQQLDAQLKMLAAAPEPKSGGKNRGPNGDPVARARIAARAQLEQQLLQSRQILERLDEITTLKEQIDGKSRLQMRIYFEAEGVPVEVLSTITGPLRKKG